MKRRATVWIVLAALLVAAVALAQVPQRTIGVRFEGGVADVSYSAADFVDDYVLRQLNSGITKMIVVRTYAYESGSSTPIAVAVNSCRVTRSDWDQDYIVREQSASVDRERHLATIEEVVQHCLVADHLRVGRASSWAGHHGSSVMFAVVVELNPLTPEGVQRMRRWLARADGGGSHEDAFFGSFVSLFVNRGIADADRTLTFRSQDITCP